MSQGKCRTDWSIEKWIIFQEGTLSDFQELGNLGNQEERGGYGNILCKTELRGQLQPLYLMRKNITLILCCNRLQCVAESIKLRIKRPGFSLPFTYYSSTSVGRFPFIWKVRALNYFNISKRMFFRALVLEILWGNKRPNEDNYFWKHNFPYGFWLGSSKQVKNLKRYRP